MKKFIYLICAALLLTGISACTSCSNTDQFGIAYSLQSEGKTDGFVEVAFINGNFKVNGDASYEFSWTNSLELNSVEKVKSLSLVNESDDPSVIEAANKVENWLDESIKVVDYEGHYDIYIKGYVEETFTHIKFEIDRRFTNIPETE